MPQRWEGTLSQAWIAGERSAIIDRRYNSQRVRIGAESGIKAAKADQNNGQFARLTLNHARNNLPAR